MKTLRVDNSALAAVAKCTTQAMLRYHLQWTSQGVKSARDAGSAAHAALALYLQGRSVAEAVDVFTGLYAKSAVADPSDRLSLGNCQRVLQKWCADHPVASLPWEPVDAESFEVPFSVPVGLLKNGTQVVLTGLMDGLVRSRADRQVYVLEHKTTGTLTGWWKKQWHVASQICGYIVAAEAMLGVPVVGAFVNCIEFGKLPSVVGRKCKEHGVSYSECGTLHAKSEILVTQRTGQQVKDWRQTVLGLAEKYQYWMGQVDGIEGIDQVPQEGLMVNACGWCDFEGFCLSGRKAWAVAGMLEQGVWAPTQQQDGGE